MNFDFRKGITNDINSLRELAIVSWSQYKNVLKEEQWDRLNATLMSNKTYIDLLNHSECIVCETEKKEIVGMAFLVPKGNPTDIYEVNWSYIRFVSVNPFYEGKGIGRKLTEKCIEYAKKNGEEVIALHTSEIMVKARALYEKLGFRIYKEIEPRLGKRYWLYLLELNNKK